MKLINRAGRTAALVVAAGLLAPVPAFAEESAGGASILIPNMAEFIPALIAFLIILVALAKLAWPSVLTMMDERSKRIEESLADAEAAKQAAAAKRREADQIVADARREAADIVLEARRDAESERARIIGSAHDEATALIARAHENIEDERRAVYASSAETVANLAVEVAGRILNERLDEAEQRKLIEKYTEQVGSLNG